MLLRSAATSLLLPGDILEGIADQVDNAQLPGFEGKPFNGLWKSRVHPHRQSRCPGAPVLEFGENANQNLAPSSVWAIQSQQFFVA